MTIEFHNPAGAVQELVSYKISKKLTELYRLYKKISRAQVYFHRRRTADGDYICAIDLTIFGSSMMVERTAKSYDLAAWEVLDDLSKKVQKQLQKEKQNDPPDQIYSSVKV